MRTGPVSLRANVDLDKVQHLLASHAVTTVSGKRLPIGQNVSEVSICCHSDTPVSVDDRSFRACSGT